MQLPAELQALVATAYDQAFRHGMRVVERDIVPDFLIRRAIRYLLQKRIAEVRFCFEEHTFSSGR